MFHGEMSTAEGEMCMAKTEGFFAATVRCQAKEFLTDLLRIIFFSESDIHYL